MSLYADDLNAMIKSRITVDEYKSKMGDDEDMIVVAFQAMDREPAWDLMNFLEKGYPFILDADVSPGEMEDGLYIIFVEFERTEKFPEQLLKVVEDVMKLTEHKKLTDWSFKYYKYSKALELTEENLRKMPLNSRDYLAKINSAPGVEDEGDGIGDIEMGAVGESIEDRKIRTELNKVRRIAGLTEQGVPKGPKMPKEDPDIRKMKDLARIP